MSLVDSLSNRIVKVIKGDNGSLTTTYFNTAGNIVLEFSADIGFIAYEIFDVDNKYKNFTERERLFTRLKKGIDKDDLSNIIEIIIKIYASKLSKDKFKKISSSLGKLTGKQFINMLILNDITSVFCKKIISKFILSFGLSTIFSLGGAISRSIYTSRELEREMPEIYSTLKKADDLDLFYFLVENYTKPFVDALILKNKNPEAFDEVFIEVIKKLDQ